MDVGGGVGADRSVVLVRNDKRLLEVFASADHGVLDDARNRLEPVVVEICKRHGVPGPRVVYDRGGPGRSFGSYLAKHGLDGAVGYFGAGRGGRFYANRRTANAFAVDTVHIVGRRRWNRRGAMVTDRYQRLRHHDTTAELLAFAADAGLEVIAVDNVPGAVRLERVSLPRHCLLIFGQEGPGITDEARLGATRTVSIAQFGSTRSINAAVAAGIAMHSWIAQHGDLDSAW